MITAGSDPLRFVRHPLFAEIRGELQPAVMRRTPPYRYIQLGRGEGARVVDDTPWVARADRSGW